MNNAARGAIICVMVICLSIVLGCVIAPAQQADDPVVTVHLRYSQWLAIGKLVGQQKIDDFIGIYNEVQSQMTAQAQAQQKAVIDTYEKQIRDKVEAEAKAKTGADKVEQKP